MLWSGATWIGATLSILRVKGAGSLLKMHKRPDVRFLWLRIRFFCVIILPFPALSPGWGTGGRAAGFAAWESEERLPAE